MKEIPQFENYAITEDGRVWNFKRKIWMKLTIGTKGYPQVCLTLNKKLYCFYVHRLVANAYIAPVDGKLYINHKNSIRNDNRVENLEWCTQRENVLHGFNHGRISGRARLTPKQVIEVRAKHTGMYGVGIKLAKEYGVSASVISSIVNNKTWGRIAS